MRIRIKAILILAVSSAVVGASLLVFSLTVLRAGFVSLEERHALLDMSRVHKAYEHRLESLGRTARDWARWDDTWRFIQGGKPGFVKDNLENESLAALDADLMVFISSDGSLVQEKALSRPGFVVPPAAATALRALDTTVILPPRDDKSLTRTGTLPFAGAPLMYATHPVYRSDGSGPAAGRFYIGRYLDGERLEELGAEVGLELSLRQPGILPVGSPDVVLRLNDDRLAVQGLFTDSSGAPAFVLEIGESREIFRRGTATIRTFLLLFIGVGFAVAGISLLALHRGVLARVESLNEQVRRISAGHQGAQDVTVHGGDELSDLARSINAMLHSLARADETLVRSERLAAVGTLAGGVAHQFNNLNTGLLGFADLALSRPGLDDETRGYLERIVKGVQRSVVITRGLLAFSGEIQQSLTPCRLDEVVAEALPLVSRDLTRHAVTLETRLAEVPAVTMDPALIQQVALNLILNAIHAVIDRSERRIVVETDVAGQFVRLAVRDTGCGISAGDLPQLFTPFFTTKGEHAAKSSSQTLVSGTGLGLSVSHAIVARHGGRLEVESTEGVGSTFTVLLPRDGDVLHAAPPLVG